MSKNYITTSAARAKVRNVHSGANAFGDTNDFVKKANCINITSCYLDVSYITSYDNNDFVVDDDIVVLSSLGGGDSGGGSTPSLPDNSEILSDDGTYIYVVELSATLSRVVGKSLTIQIMGIGQWTTTIKAYTSFVVKSNTKITSNSGSCLLYAQGSQGDPWRPTFNVNQQYGYDGYWCVLSSDATDFENYVLKYNP